MRPGLPAFDHLWRSLPRFLAGWVGAVAALSPARTVGVLAMTLGFGTTAFVAVASVGHPAQQAAGPTTLEPRPAPTVSRDETQRPDVPLGSAGSFGAGTSRGPSSAGARSPRAQEAGERGGQRPGRTQASSPADRSLPSAGAATAHSTAPPASPPSSPPPSTPPGAGAGGSEAPDDHGAPDTGLRTEYPASDAVRFTFTADHSSSYLCSLDGAAYTSCDSPVDLSDLHPGWHTFAVRAVDAHGHADPTPAHVRWHVDRGSSGRSG